MRWIFPLIAFAVISGCANPKSPPPSVAADGTGACSTRFRKSGACVTWTWRAQPWQDEAELEWRVDPSTPLSEVRVELIMPTMTHPNPPTQTRSLQAGVFLTTQMIFLMRGEWQVILRGRLPDSTWDEAIVHVVL